MYIAWGPKQKRESMNSVAVRFKTECDGRTARDVRGLNIPLDIPSNSALPNQKLALPLYRVW